MDGVESSLDVMEERKVMGVMVCKNGIWQESPEIPKINAGG